MPGNRPVPRLSVVIPHYNHTQHLAEAVNAIMSQSRRPDEVVLVDDGSEPESLRWVENLVAGFPEIRLIRHPENRGVNTAVKTGLAAVTGDFVAFTSADDRLVSGAVEKVVRALALNPRTGLVFSDLAEMNEDGSNLQVMSLALANEARYFAPDEFRRILRHSFFYFNTGSMWFNTADLRYFAGFDDRLRWHADLYAAYGIGMLRGATYVPSAYACYRRSAGSYSRGRQGRAQIAVLEAWLAKTREPSGWDSRRAFRDAAVLPDYGFFAVRALRSDRDFITVALVLRIISRTVWGWLRPLLPWGFRRLVRRIVSRRFDA